jgi:hypothetical protein
MSSPQTSIRESVRRHQLERHHQTADAGHLDGAPYPSAAGIDVAVADRPDRAVQARLARNRLLVALTTTSQCAVVPTLPIRSCLQVTYFGFSPASASRCVMSSCNARLETVGTFIPPLFTLQPASAQHSSPAAARHAANGFIQPPGICYIYILRKFLEMIPGHIGLE